MDKLKTHCNTYIDTQTRDVQKSTQIYEYSMNSIDEIGKKIIVNECEKYTTINVKSGPILFKLITSKAIVDNRSTTNHLREQLNSLDTHIYECGNYTINFNFYVQGLELALKARGHNVEDLNLNLFKGYAACFDEKFREYTEKKKDDYVDGFDMTPKKLMTYAENKYNIMMRTKVWNIVSPDQKKIAALSSTVQELKDSKLKLAKAFSGKSRKATFNDRNDKDTDFWA